jgi:hypothetical protein
VWLNPGKENERYLGSLFSSVPISAGDTITRPSAGGGGLGDPLERDLDAVCEDVCRIVRRAVKEVREAKGSTSALEANSKFEGFVGSFASLDDYHAGAEETLQLGYPNPDVEAGIRNELTAHPSARRLFGTPNYLLATCLDVEYWWSLDPDRAPKEVTDLLRRLREERGPDSEDQGATAGQGRAEAGKGQVELVILRGRSEDVDIDAEGDGAVDQRAGLAGWQAEGVAEGRERRRRLAADGLDEALNLGRVRVR